MRKQMDFKTAVFVLVGIVLLLQVMGTLGIGAKKSSVHLQIGYWEKSSAQSWSADYILWDGWQQRTLHPTTQPATLHVTVQTDAGSCALQIKSADGEILFEREDLPTSAFDVDIPGDVVVRFTADQHKGGFSAEILE